ncbi:MAG TPA: hypothetical protein VFE97_17395 [Methylomirabilota bacterium]|jgi:hypothetical protein|nr:hypothetical protein [Methylomirabilota bacterium]
MIDGPHATDRRRALLVAALGFCFCSGERCSEDREAGSNRGWPETDASRLRTPDPETPLTILRGWLSSWRGIGLVAAGMARQGYDLSLTRYADFGWRATFYVTGREHSPTGATGSAFEVTPFRAVQVAAWETLTRT